MGITRKPHLKGVPGFTPWCLEDSVPPSAERFYDASGYNWGSIGPADLEYAQTKPQAGRNRCFMCQAERGSPHDELCSEIRDKWLIWPNGKFKGKPASQAPLNYSVYRLKMMLQEHFGRWRDGELDGSDWFLFWIQLAHWLHEKGAIAINPFEDPVAYDGGVDMEIRY